MELLVEILGIFFEGVLADISEVGSVGAVEEGVFILQKGRVFLVGLKTFAVGRFDPCVSDVRIVRVNDRTL